MTDAASAVAKPTASALIDTDTASATARAAVAARAAAAIQAADSPVPFEEAESIFWASINEDAKWLTNGKNTANDLIRQRLWLNDVRDKPDQVANFPSWVRTPFDEFNKSSLVQKGPWDVWLTWYRAILPNRRNVKPWSAFGEKADRAIAMLPKEFWDRDPDQVTADIAGAVDPKAPTLRTLVSRWERAGEPAVEEPTDDRLIEQLLSRRLAVSTLASDDLASARSLLEGPEKWGLGPEIERGDFLVIYLPKTVAKKKELAKRGPQRSGLRFLFLAAEASRDAGPEYNFRQIVRIADRIELSRPLDPKQFNTRPLADWGLANANFRRAGMQKEPLPEELARALWTEILEQNPEIRPELEVWIEKESGDETQPSQMRHELEYISDRPETGRDLLGRAPLAFALAAQINRIWEAQTIGEPEAPWWKRLCDALHITRAVHPPHRADEAAFIMHIDAPWGGGKTTFANFIARILNPTAFGLDSSSDELLENLPLNDNHLWKPAYHERRWQVVQFNAWQHEHVSPPWWNFDEVIRRQCLQGLLRNPGSRGPEQAALWGLIPSGLYHHIQTKGRWLWYVFRELAWRVWSPATRRAVQAALLFTVIASFVYWTGFATSLESFKIDGVSLKQIATWVGVGGVGVLTFKALWTGLSTFVESVSSSADVVTLGEADPLNRFQTHFSWFIRQLDKPVLVIVDDLDRCKPEYVVELVRGLLTIFRSPRVVFLLLGDKNWVEQAFAHVHEDRKVAHESGQISFGGRFAEKAIQLSFILPEANEEERNDYLLALLTGKPRVVGTGNDRAVFDEASNGAEDTAPEEVGNDRVIARLREFEREVRERLSETRDTEELVRAKAETRAEIEMMFPDRGDANSEDTMRQARQAAERTLDVEASYRSSTSDRSEEDIRHGIEPVALYLPSNPRRIKRIINMISAFQESGQISAQIDPLSREWRQLVLWTVLMSEYPRVWRTLVLDTETAQEVVRRVGEAGDDGSIELPPLTDSSDENARARRARLAEIISDKTVVRLLRGDPFNETSNNGESHALDDDALAFLRRLTPIN